jgi:uncharacterized protein (TIGR02001 family)
VERTNEKSNKKLLPAAIVAASVATPALAEFDMDLGVTSNYMFRGVTRSDNGPAVSGGLNYQHESGFYVGGWATNVKMNNIRAEHYLVNITGGSSFELAELNSIPSYETQGFVGFTGGFDRTPFAYDIGYVYYAYLDSPEHVDMNYGEVYLSLSYDIVAIGGAVVVNSDGYNENRKNDTKDFYLWATIGTELGHNTGWSWAFTVGHTWYENDGALVFFDGPNDVYPIGEIKDYTNVQLDISKNAGDFGDLTLSVSYADSQAQNAEDDPVVFVSWNKDWSF